MCTATLSDEKEICLSVTLPEDWQLGIVTEHSNIDINPYRTNVENRVSS